MKGLKRVRLSVHGAKDVGKTQLLRVLANQPYLRTKKPTEEGGDVDEFVLQKAIIHAWDMPELSFAITEHYFTSMDIILLVFDSAALESAQFLMQNYSKFEKKYATKKLILVGAKADSDTAQVDSFPTICKFATKHQLPFFMVSAHQPRYVAALQDYIALLANAIVSIKQLDDLKPIHPIAQQALTRIKLVLNTRFATSDASVFNAHQRDLDRDLGLIASTMLSRCNTILNLCAVILAVCSIVGWLLLWKRGVFQANYKASGHSLMFFNFGEKQQAMSVLHQVTEASLATRMMIPA